MKNKMILKITIAIVVIAVIAIIIYFFSRNVNKNSKMGNNLSNKTNQEIEEYILRISKNSRIKRCKSNNYTWKNKRTILYRRSRLGYYKTSETSSKYTSNTEMEI